MCESSVAARTAAARGGGAAPRRAFTLLELLVTMGLVAVLLTLVIVPLHGVRQSANRTNSLNGLKQMVLAYSAYSTDHRYQLMPGFLGETLLSELKITAELPGGTSLADCDAGMICDASGYVWRLAPYLDDVWKTMFVDYRSKSLLSQLEVESWCGIYGSGTLSTPCQALGELGLTPIGIGKAPSFGMNSIFVGGDSFHGGPEVKDHNPWTGSEEKLAATRFSEVKNPAKLIVFGTAALASASGFVLVDDEVYANDDRWEGELGYVELRAPFTVFDADTERWSNQQWAIGKQGSIVRTTTGDYMDSTGLPVSRWGARLLPVANLDGSTGVEETSVLAVDMRRWSPFAFGMNVPAFVP